MVQKNDAKKGMVFLVLLVLAILLVNAVYENFVLTQKTFYRNELRYQSYVKGLQGKEINVLFMGDSHIFHGINPEYLDNSFNYASGAENYIKTYYKVRNVLETDSLKVNTLVLQIDPHTFSTRYTDEDNLLSEYELYHNFITLKEAREITGDGLFNLWLEGNLPVLGNGEEFGILLGGIKLQEINKYGWLKSESDYSLKEDKEAELQRSYDIAFNNQERISNLSFEYYLRTIDLAQKHNVTLVLIKMPLSDDYFTMLKQRNITNENYYETIFEATNKTISHYFVLDYSGEFTEKEYLFGDPDHVNFIGAEILSKQIGEDLEERGLSK